MLTLILVLDRVVDQLPDAIVASHHLRTFCIAVLFLSCDCQLRMEGSQVIPAGLSS